MDDLSVSWGRDYSTSSRFEYVVFRGRGGSIVAREGGFKRSDAAKRAGLRKMQELAR